MVTRSLFGLECYIYKHDNASHQHGDGMRAIEPSQVRIAFLIVYFEPIMLRSPFPFRVLSCGLHAVQEGLCGVAFVAPLLGSEMIEATYTTI